MSHAPFLILETGTPLPALRRHGGFAHWIRVAAGLHARQTVTCRVADGEPLPTAEGWRGVLITGSGAMVTERRPWSEASASWLREAGARGVPLFGICYGHQLLAHAFGGEVGDNPQGREMGTATVELHDPARHDPLFGTMPARFAAQTTHLQTVLAPPPGATVLARSSRDACQAFRLGEHTWGVQFHPEFSSTMMRGYIAGRAAALHAEGTDARHLHRAVRPTPLARRVLARFVRHAQRHR
ncbi:MAG: glutamine amidotransferase [Chiayiivirga sp.]|jgi:GMP synthase (glutamine-hydrolysing)|uniref:glutamine amidotransferase n=1 Tax=Chiayiivirga sp. TaxID=2041042 RepID=UPI0025C41890|nr:glutamine amidotransferase [Chiayiivirga sp.]MCI1711768.1 glutamine amidotransferase [Chiayiivirga sp.]MCI1729652.1 glutamine amidotransferase [Chiayiivirga sp.]